MKVLAIQSCPTLCKSMDCSPPGSSVRGILRARVGCHFLLQGIFPTQGWNLGLLHCRQILYCLSHRGSPVHASVSESRCGGRTNSPFSVPDPSTSPRRTEVWFLHPLAWRGRLSTAPGWEETRPPLPGRADLALLRCICTTGAASCSLPAPCSTWKAQPSTHVGRQTRPRRLRSRQTVQTSRVLCQRQGAGYSARSLR